MNNALIGQNEISITPYKNTATKMEEILHISPDNDKISSENDFGNSSGQESLIEFTDMNLN